MRRETGNEQAAEVHCDERVELVGWISRRPIHRIGHRNEAAGYASLTRPRGYGLDTAQCHAVGGHDHVEF